MALVRLKQLCEERERVLSNPDAVNLKDRYVGVTGTKLPHESITTVRSSVPDGSTFVGFNQRTILHHQRGAKSQSIDFSIDNSVKDLTELNDYARYAEGIYGWLLHLFRKHKATISKRIPINDNCCNFNYNALSSVVPSHAHLIHVDFQEAICVTPWALYVDAELKSVVVAVRGSLSLGDVLTDLLAVSEDLGVHSEYLGFDAKGEYAHKGMWNAARRICDYLEKEKLLESLLKDVRTADELPFCKNYKLVVTGHSLGAGTASLVALILRKKYPAVKCFAYSPPGAVCTKGIAELCEEFTHSLVIGKDVVCRLSLPAVVKLRDEIYDVSSKCKKSKYSIFWYLIFKRNLDISDLLSDTVVDDTRQKSQLFNIPIEEVSIENPMSKYIPSDGRPVSQRMGKKPMVQNGLTIDVTDFTRKMYIPGRITHLVKMITNSHCCGSTRLNQRSEVYYPVVADKSDLNRVEVSPMMGEDHLPNKVFNVLNEVTKSVCSNVREKKKNTIAKDNDVIHLEIDEETKV